MSNEIRNLLIAVAAGGAVLATSMPVSAQGVVVQMTPPPVREEVVPAAPGPTESWAWRRGHWAWNGANYIWVRGEYIHRIRPSAVWVPGHWVPQAGGYAWIDGHWR